MSKDKAFSKQHEECFFLMKDEDYAIEKEAFDFGEADGCIQECGFAQPCIEEESLAGECAEDPFRSDLEELQHLRREQKVAFKVSCAL